MVVAATVQTPSSTPQSAMRQSNLARVLQLVREAPRSRARLADHTSLNKTTVSSLVSELVARDLVSEGSAAVGHVGRPGAAVRLQAASTCALGAEINVDYLAVCAVDLSGEVIDERRMGVDGSQLGPEELAVRLAMLIGPVLTTVAGQGRSVIGLTVAVPGLVSPASDVVVRAPNLGWVDVPFAETLRRRLEGDVSYRISSDNEANLAAIAEYAVRRPAVSDLLLLTGDVGVGAGIVVDGKLYRGHFGFGGEVGHMPVETTGGSLCGCGRRGCWETRVGLPALLNGVVDRHDAALDPKLDVVDRLNEVVRRAEAGDPRTLNSLEQLGTWLGIGAATLVNVVDPGLIVLGGYFSAVGRWVLDPMRRELSARAIASEGVDYPLEVSTLGLSAAVRGAAQMSLEAIFTDPTMSPRRDLREQASRA